MAASLVIRAFRPQFARFQVARFARAGLRLVDGEPPGLVLRAREQYLPGRAAVEVFFGVVGELLLASLLK